MKEGQDLVVPLCRLAPRPRMASQLGTGFRPHRIEPFLEAAKLRTMRHRQSSCERHNTHVETDARHVPARSLRSARKSDCKPRRKGIVRPKHDCQPANPSSVGEARRAFHRSVCRRFRETVPGPLMAAYPREPRGEDRHQRKIAQRAPDVAADRGPFSTRAEWHGAPFRDGRAWAEGLQRRRAGRCAGAVHAADTPVASRSPFCCGKGPPAAHRERHDLPQKIAGTVCTISGLRVVAIIRTPDPARG
jgi:hypothetical protein